MICTLRDHKLDINHPLLTLGGEMLKRIGLVSFTISVLLINVLALPTQAFAAPANNSIPNLSLIPAFDHDLPFSNGQSLTSSSIISNPLSIPALPSTAATSWTCSVFARAPFISGRAVFSEGSQTCSGSGWAAQRIRVTVQKYLGLGYWNNLATIDSGPVFAYYTDQIINFNCSTLGVQTYRTVVDAYAANGAAYQAFQSDVYLRSSC
jgi:hypothetical protein